MNFKIRQSVILISSIYYINNSYCMEIEYNKYHSNNNNQNQINLSDENKINEKNSNIQNINERIQKVIDYLNNRLSDYLLKTEISKIGYQGKKLLSMDNIFDYISSLHLLHDNIQNNKNIISNEQIKQIEYMENRIKTDSYIKNKILTILQKRKLGKKSKEESIETKEACKPAKQTNNSNIINNMKKEDNIETKEAYKPAKQTNNSNIINNMKINVEMENKIKAQAQEQEMKEIINHTISINNAKRYMSTEYNVANIPSNTKLFFQELAKTADEIIKGNRVSELKLLRNYFKNEYGINKDTKTWEQKFLYCLAYYIDLGMNNKKSNILPIIYSMLNNNEISNSQYKSLLKLFLYTDYMACLSQKSYSFNEINKLITEIDGIIVNRINRKYYKNIVLNLIKPILKEQISNELKNFDIKNSESNQKLRHENILDFSFNNLKSTFIDGLTYAILPVIEQNAVKQHKQLEIDRNKLISNIKELLKNNATINRCVIQILNLPEYFKYIREFYSNVIRYNKELNKNTISFIKGMENITSTDKYDKKHYNEDTSLFCKYIVKELNSLINNKISSNTKKYKVEEYLLFDIFLRCDYMLCNIDTNMFYEYITSLYKNKDISNNEYKAGLDFLLYKSILSGNYLTSSVLTSYIDVLLPTSEKEWENIVADDIKNNRTEQNSILINKIIQKIIKRVNYWNERANKVYDYKNKNEYFKRVFNRVEITENKQNYINKILNNKNYDIFYNLYLNKHNAFFEFYTYLGMLKPYKRNTDNKQNYNNDNQNKIIEDDTDNENVIREKPQKTLKIDKQYNIANITGSLYKLYENDKSNNKNEIYKNIIQDKNKRWANELGNKKNMPDTPMLVLVKHILSNNLSGEQKVYLLSRIIPQIEISITNESGKKLLEAKDSRIISSYTNNIIKYYNKEFKPSLTENIKSSFNNNKYTEVLQKNKMYEEAKKVLNNILNSIEINNDTTVNDILSIVAILKNEIDTLNIIKDNILRTLNYEIQNNQKNNNILLEHETINNCINNFINMIQKVEYVLTDFSLKFDVKNNPNIGELTLYELQNLNEVSESRNIIKTKKSKSNSFFETID